MTAPSPSQLLSSQSNTHSIQVPLALPVAGSLNDPWGDAAPHTARRIPPAKAKPFNTGSFAESACLHTSLSWAGSRSWLDHPKPRLRSGRVWLRPCSSTPSRPGRNVHDACTKTNTVGAASSQGNRWESPAMITGNTQRGMPPAGAGQGSPGNPALQRGVFPPPSWLRWVPPIAFTLVGVQGKESALGFHALPPWRGPASSCGSRPRSQTWARIS